MKSGAEFEQGRYPAMHLDGSLIGPCETGDETEQRALARAVASDHREALPTVDAERNSFQSVKLCGRIFLKPERQLFAEELRTGMVTEGFPNILAGDDG